MDSGSDSEGAPEEVTLNEGREEAVKKQAREKAAKKRALAEAKEVRRKRSRKGEEEETEATPKPALNPGDLNRGGEEEADGPEPKDGTASADQKTPKARKKSTRVKRGKPQEEPPTGNLPSTDSKLARSGQADGAATSGATGLEGLNGALVVGRSENGTGGVGEEKDEKAGKDEKRSRRNRGRRDLEAAPLLPESVLQALAERERNVAEARVEESAEPTTAQERKRKNRKEKSNGAKSLRVGVEVARLPKPNGAALPPPSDAALQFKQHHLFGSRVKRTLRMLDPKGTTGTSRVSFFVNS